MKWDECALLAHCHTLTGTANRVWISDLLARADLVDDGGTILQACGRNPPFGSQVTGRTCMRATWRVLPVPDQARMRVPVRRSCASGHLSGSRHPGVYSEHDRSTSIVWCDDASSCADARVRWQTMRLPWTADRWDHVWHGGDCVCKRLQRGRRARTERRQAGAIRGAPGGCAFDQRSPALAALYVRYAGETHAAGLRGPPRPNDVGVPMMVCEGSDRVAGRITRLKSGLRVRINLPSLEATTDPAVSGRIVAHLFSQSYGTAPPCPDRPARASVWLTCDKGPSPYGAAWRLTVSRHRSTDQSDGAMCTAGALHRASYDARARDP